MATKRQRSAQARRAGIIGAAVRKAKRAGANVARAKADAIARLDAQRARKSAAAKLGWERRRAIEAARVKTDGAAPGPFRPQPISGDVLTVWEAPRIAGQIDPDAAFAILADLHGAIAAELGAAHGRDTSGEKIHPRIAVNALRRFLAPGMTVRVEVGVSVERFSMGGRQVLTEQTRTTTFVCGPEPLHDVYQAVADLLRDSMDRAYRADGYVSDHRGGSDYSLLASFIRVARVAASPAAA